MSYTFHLLDWSDPHASAFFIVLSKWKLKEPWYGDSVTNNPNNYEFQNPPPPTPTPPVVKPRVIFPTWKKIMEPKDKGGCGPAPPPSGRDGKVDCVGRNCCFDKITQAICSQVQQCEDCKKRATTGKPCSKEFLDKNCGKALELLKRKFDEIADLCNTTFPDGHHGDLGADTCEDKQGRLVPYWWYYSPRRPECAGGRDVPQGTESFNSNDTDTILDASVTTTTSTTSLRDITKINLETDYPLNIDYGVNIKYFFYPRFTTNITIHNLQQENFEKNMYPYPSSYISYPYATSFVTQ